MAIEMHLLKKRQTVTPLQMCVVGVAKCQREAFPLLPYQTPGHRYGEGSPYACHIQPCLSLFRLIGGIRKATLNSQASS